MEFDFDAMGNLILTISGEEQEELQDGESYYDRMQLVSEWLHERLVFVAPETIGALTDAPILCPSDETWIEDNGDRAFVPNFNAYWFPNYALRDEWQELADTGRVMFNLAPISVD